MALQKIKKIRPSKHEVWSQCEKKNRYKDETEAQRIINERMADGSRDRLRYYECHFCDGFHITKAEKK